MNGHPNICRDDGAVGAVFWCRLKKTLFDGGSAEGDGAFHVLLNQNHIADNLRVTIIKFDNNVFCQRVDQSNTSLKNKKILLLYWCAGRQGCFWLTAGNG